MGRVSVWNNEKVLEIDSDDGCTTLWMCLMPSILYLKMIKIVNFMLPILYHNKNKAIRPSVPLF